MTTTTSQITSTEEYHACLTTTHWGSWNSMNEGTIFELLVHVKSFKFMRQELFLSPSVVGWNDGKYGSGGNRISGSATIHLAQKTLRT